jgi:hypothetical protein
MRKNISKDKASVKLLLAGIVAPSPLVHIKIITEGTGSWRVLKNDFVGIDLFIYQHQSRSEAIKNISSEGDVNTLEVIICLNYIHIYSLMSFSWDN